MRRRNVTVAAVLGTVAAATTVVAAPAPAGSPPPLFATSDQLPRLPQRHDHAVRGRRLDRVRLAGVDDGQRGARPVLASRRPARDRRLPRRRAVIQNECAACHMPMARFEAHVAGRKLEVFSRLGGGPRAAAAIRWRWTGCPARSATSFRTAARGSSTTANSRSTPPARGASVWCSGLTTSRPRARASCTRRRGSSPRARPTWNSPSSARPATRSTRRRSAGRRRQAAGALPRAGAVPGMAGERLRPREELPGLPHDVHRRAHARGERARRAARAVRAPRIPGRELLHAGDAGTVPRRAGRRGAAPGAEPVAAADAGAAAHERRDACRSRAPRSATVAWRPRSSSPTRRATSSRRRTRRAASGSASWSATATGGGCSRRARCAPTAASRGTTTTAIRWPSSRTIGSSRPRTRCRSTNRSWRTRAGA